MTVDSRSALGSRNYRIYLSGSIFGVHALWILRLALGWQAWELSESAFIVGLVAGLQFLPAVVLTPIFGVLADQINPRKGALLLHLAHLAVGLCLAILTAMSLMNVEWLLLLALMHGLTNSAYGPIRLSLVPMVVGTGRIASAVAISSSIFNFSRFAGPAIGGFLIARFGLAAGYFAAAAMFVPPSIVLNIIRVAKRDTDSGSRGSYLSRLLEGVRYTKDHLAIRQVFLLAGVSNFCGRAIIEIMPAIAALEFGGGSAVLATLVASAGIGAFIASILFNSPWLHSRLHGLVAACTIGTGMSLAAFSTISSLFAGTIVVGVLGFFVSMVAMGSQTHAQLLVADRLRGRVMSFWNLVIMGGPALGSIIAGASAGRYGTSATAVSFSVTCLLLILVVGVRRPPPQSA